MFYDVKKTQVTLSPSCTPGSARESVEHTPSCSSGGSFSGLLLPKNPLRSLQGITTFDPGQMPQ